MALALHSTDLLDEAQRPADQPRPRAEAALAEAARSRAQAVARARRVALFEAAQRAAPSSGRR